MLEQSNALEDAEGTTPQISIDLSALQPLFESTAEAVKAGIIKRSENIKRLISKYNEFIDKLEYNILRMEGTGEYEIL